MEKPSPVQIIRQGTKVTIEMASTGAVLAVCAIGDDETLEMIADLLSSKRLPEDAMRLRKMAQDARKPQRVNGL